MSVAGFYIVNSRSSKTLDGTTTLVEDISIDSAHEVFEGHFPGLPVVPGVCMMQIVKDTLMNHAGIVLTLKEASNVKFLSVLNPTEQKDVVVEVIASEKESNYVTTSRIYKGDVIFFKMQAVFQPTLSKFQGSVSA